MKQADLKAMEQLCGVLRDRLAEIDVVVHAMAGRSGEIARTWHQPVSHKEIGAWSDEIGRAADAIRRAAGLVDALADGREGEGPDHE